MTQTGFTAEVYQNEFLPAGGRIVDAVVTVSAGGAVTVPAGQQAPAPGEHRPPSAAQVIIVDTSGSMAYPPTKLANAQKATGAAIDVLRDGVPFAVVAGDSMARMVYPIHTGMEPAGAASRAAAKAAVRRLQASGGTAISTWLALAERLFGMHGAEVNHAILLTDGQNGEPTSRLRKVLSSCEGKFVCDSRGVGTDWVATELREIASALLGSADGLDTPEELPDVFRRLTEGAMGKQVANVALRLWTPAGSTIRFVKQVFPHIEDLTGRRTAVSERIGEYPTGAWGAESRDYHVSIEVEPDDVGEEVWPPGSRLSPAGSRWSSGWCWPGGPRTRRCPPGSARTWRTTRGRPSSRRRSRRASPPGPPATRTPRPRSSARRCGSPPSRAGRTPRNCWAGWST